MKIFYMFSFYLIMMILSSKVFAQAEPTEWKLLMNNEQQSIWYGDKSIDTLQNSKVNVWVQQLNKPYIEIEGLHGNIYRSLTQYAVDLKLKKYGILKILYYDTHNKKIYNFNYHIDNFEDRLKYSYPAEKDTVLRELVSRLNTNNSK